MPFPSGSPKRRKKATRKKTASRPASRDDGFAFELDGDLSKYNHQALVILGAAGCGKSSLAAQFPKPLFITDGIDVGIRKLKARRSIPSNVRILRDPVDKWYRLMEVCEELFKQPPGQFLTLVFESISGLQSMAFEACCREEYGGDWSKTGFLNYQQGPIATNEKYWQPFTQQLEMLRSAGYNVIVTGHTENKTVNNAQGIDYDTEIAYANKHIWSSTYRWADAVLIMSQVPDVEEQAGKSSGKLLGHDDRQLFVDMSNAFKAKNRWNLSGSVRCGKSAAEAYKNLCKAAKLDPATGCDR